MTPARARKARQPDPRQIFERELLFGETSETFSALVKSLGLSQQELAVRLGLSEARVSRILSGRENLTLKALADLGWALGVRIMLTPVPFEDRGSTPATDDPPPPDWLEELRRDQARQRVTDPTAKA